MNYSKRVEPYYPYTTVRPEEADAAYRLLRECAFGIAHNSQHTAMTPYRLAHYLNYWTRPDELPRFTTFDNIDPVVDQLVVIGPIPYWACCTHHLLPFFGSVSFGYIPDLKLVGLSMVPLFVKEFCARPWLQETMTLELADFFERKLEPKGLGLVTDATHTCQLLDLGGPPVPKMVFSEMRGLFRSKARVRMEFLDLMRRQQ